MADEVDNDDQWLYGEGDQHDAPKIDNQQEAEPPERTPPLEPKENGTDNDLQTTEETNNMEQDTEEKNEIEQEEINKENDQDENKDKQDQEDDVDGQQNGDDEDLEDDDSDDDVNVVIGDIKTTPSYTSMNIKRGSNLLTTTQTDKSKQPPQSGKFSVEEFDQVGMINGVPATEYNLDSLEDKPWRKPGADITDYFNYGFNEDTWRAYCERQKRMRVNESGVGLAAQINPLARAGPPPGRRMTGSIDVIGGATTRITPAPVGKPDAPKMNVIQVMTADRREYSRKPTGFPDMTVPPPSTFEEFQPEYGFNPEPEPFYGGYEPTQDSQWGPDGGAGPPPPDWQPTEIKSLTPGPMAPPNMPPHNMGPPMPIPVPSPRPEKSPPRAHSRERERSREVSRARSERRDRERSHRRERSRSRSRRHRSRSRSPSHRSSHKKKKSRRHDDSE